METDHNHTAVTSSLLWRLIWVASLKFSTDTQPHVYPNPNLNHSIIVLPIPLTFPPTALR